MSELRDRIKGTIEQEPVVAFIKGTHEQVFCGNSDRALQALRGVGAGFATVDVLPDPRIREELSALSDWPTIPQVFVAGELVGGADIVQELALTGRARGDAGGEARRDVAAPRRRAHRRGDRGGGGTARRSERLGTRRDTDAYGADVISPAGSPGSPADSPRRRFLNTVAGRSKRASASRRGSARSVPSP